jgi:hypothetical protein
MEVALFIDPLIEGNGRLYHEDRHEDRDQDDPGMGSFLHGGPLREGRAVRSWPFRRNSCKKCIIPTGCSQEREETEGNSEFLLHKTGRATIIRPWPYALTSSPVWTSSSAYGPKTSGMRV